MKVRMKTQLLGARNGVRWPAPGAEVDLPDLEAAKLCKADLATPVVDQGEEQAVPATMEELRTAPPLSGPGSGVKAWREHAAAVTASEVEDWAEMTRDEIVERLNAPDVPPNDDPATAEREANADAEAAKARAEAEQD